MGSWIHPDYIAETVLDYAGVVARADALKAGTATFEKAGPGRLEGEDAILAANLERMVGEGMADETTGDVETFAYYSRVGRFIVSDDSQGFMGIEDAGDEETAKARFAELDAEYAAIGGDVV